MADEEREDLDVIELESSLSDVEKPPELPAGLYLGQVQDVQTAASQKGNTYYAIKFVIPPDEIPADLQDQFEDGCILFYNRLIRPTLKDRRALFNLKKFVEAIGLDTESTTINPNDWMGCEARLRVRHRVYQGERRAEIQSVEPAEVEAAPRQRAEEPEAPPARAARGGRRR